jgi:hypothetical protein
MYPVPLSEAAAAIADYEERVRHHQLEVAALRVAKADAAPTRSLFCSARFLGRLTSLRRSTGPVRTV